MADNPGLKKLTGLDPDEIAETMINNSRAYQALRGSCAERHLENMLERLYKQGCLYSYRVGDGDNEKDFYIKSNAGSQEVVLECK